MSSNRAHREARDRDYPATGVAVRHGIIEPVTVLLYDDQVRDVIMYQVRFPDGDERPMHHADVLFGELRA